MFHPGIRRLTLPVLISAILLTSNVLVAAEAIYRATTTKDRKLYIILDDGREILAPKLHDQVAFQAPAVAPNHRTVGWLVDYLDPATASYPLPGALAIYRGGRIIHVFKTNQVFWDWQFRDDGNRVAYSIGPTHGGAQACILANSESGKMIARWWVTTNERPPYWAKSLRGIP
jgi:hypothetical protein